MNCFDSFGLPAWLLNTLLHEAANSMLVIFLPSLPYTHVFSGPSVFFLSRTLSLFLDLFLVLKLTLQE